MTEQHLQVRKTIEHAGDDQPQRMQSALGGKAEYRAFK
jgi:hypothetical protein